MKREGKKSLLDLLNGYKWKKRFLIIGLACVFPFLLAVTKKRKKSYLKIKNCDLKSYSVK